MKAVVYSEFGPPDVLHTVEVAKPEPKGHEVLVKVAAASINYGDASFVKGQPFMVRLMGAGLRQPKYPILGSNIAGTVESTGINVTRFVVGDAVFGDISGCGWGGFGEYVAVPESALLAKPINTSMPQAAATPQSATVAWQALQKGNIQPGTKVLIIGASGGIGSFAVGIAKALGAEVTGVCSTRNVELVRSIGADNVIDYTQEDFASKGERYDLILATAGYRPINDYKHVLKSGGCYVSTGGDSKQTFQAMVRGPWLSMMSDKSFSALMSKPNVNDLAAVKQLIEAGKVKPLIDRCYSLSEVAEAIRYYDTGRARGKVIIIVNDTNHMEART